MAEVIDRDNTSSPGSAGRGGSASDPDASDRSPLDAAGRGWLLEETRERKVVGFLWSRWDQWDDEAARWIAQWKANRWRRSGLTGVVLRRPNEDRSWSVYAPPSSVRLAPAFNQAARLCRQLVSNVWADPPAPEAIPGKAQDDDAENAAEFAGRWLRAIDSQPPADLMDRMKTAFDLASTYDSGFLLIEVDPRGGGHRFVTMLASPAATGPEDATHRPGVDPFTGEPIQVPQPPPFVTRMVAKGGAAFTEDPSAAEIEWLPAIRAVPLTGMQVRPTTKDALDVEQAEGLLVARYQTLGELRKKYPAIGELTFPQLRKLVDYEPEHASFFLPTGVKQVRKLTREDLAARYGRFAGEDDTDPGSTDPVSLAGILRAAAADEDMGAEDADDSRDALDIPDDIHVFTLCLYQKGHTSGYPWGAEVCIAGDTKHGRVLYRGELAGEQEVQGEQGPERRKEALPIPVSQCKQFREGVLDFYGIGAMTILGPGNEARATFVSSMVEHLDRFNRRKVFYSPNSLFQPKAANGAMGTYVPVADGTEPKFEQVPNYPQAGVDMFSLSTQEMADDIGLQPVSQGKTDTSVKSALHAATIVEQVVVNLSDVRQNAERFIVRTWRVCLAWAWARFTREQTLQFFGDDQSYKAEDWLGSDLGSTRDVRIARSSFTMYSPSAKLQVAEYATSLGIMDQEQLKRAFTGGMGADVGLQDDPALLRIRRQINEFWKGPPEGWEPPGQEPVIGPDMLPVMDPETGQPAMQPTPPSSTPFLRVPADLEPALMTATTMPSEQMGSQGRGMGIPPTPIGGNAMLRARELARASMLSRFDRLMQGDELSQAWAQLLLAEYEEMRVAAGIQTIPEQQQAMQAQQQAEQQAMQQQAELEQQGREQELAAKGQSAEMVAAARSTEMEQKAAAGEQQLATDATKAQMQLDQAAQKGALDLEIARRKAAAAAPGGRARPTGAGSRGR